MNEPRRPGRCDALAQYGVLFLSLIVFAKGAIAGGILQDSIRRVDPLSATATVSIRNTDGRIYIYGSDVPELQIKAERRAFTKERLEAIKVDVVIDGESARIETIYPPPPPAGSIFADRSGTVDYTIILPETCSLDKVELGNGEVIIEGMRGPKIDVSLKRGLMTLEDCFSATQANLGQGGLAIRYGWWEARTFSLWAQVDNGDLLAFLPRETALHVDATSSEGHIENHFTGEKDAGNHLETQFGATGEVKFTLRTTRGNIKIGRSN